MAEAKIEVTGIAMVRRRLAKAAGDTARGMERGQVKAALRLLALSQQVVPVDTGALKRSGFASKAGSGFSTQMTVGYSTPYAIYVHEDVDASHAPGKIAKYLEKPARDHAAELREIIAKEAAKGDRGSIPTLIPPDISSHVLLPGMPKGPGSFLRQVSGRKVTYVRRANARSGAGGWRRAR